ncbi:MAG: hypothetical protein Q4F72_03540 [Desulfovibrionaceae bacterium]|nr:hypothetical protein [Desulfovibrionaceae bacterium]
MAFRHPGFSAAILLAALLALPALPVCQPCEALAATEGFSTSPSPPQTGLEPTGEPLKNRKQPVIGSFTDAYGNPITGEMPEKKVKKRLRPGAYGGAPQTERPLPDPEDQSPVW